MVDLIQKSLAMQGEYLAGSPGLAVPHLHGNASNLGCGLIGESPAACAPSGLGPTKPPNCSMQSHYFCAQAGPSLTLGYTLNQLINRPSLSQNEGCPANSPPAGPK